MLQQIKKRKENITKKNNKLVQKMKKSKFID
jgi:hypothetical protein